LTIALVQTITIPNPLLSHSLFSFEGVNPERSLLAVFFCCLNIFIYALQKLKIV